MLFFICIFYTTFAEDRRFTLKQFIEITIPYFSALLLIFSFPLTRFVLSFDSNGYYIRGNGFFILRLLNFVYLFFVIIIALNNKSKFSKLQLISVVIYTLLTILAIFIQMLFPTALISLFFTSITILLIYLSIDNLTDYMDSITDNYNKAAFMLITARNFSHHKKFNIIGIQIEDITYLNETIGYDNLNRLLRQIATFLSSIAPDNYSFRLSGSKMAIIVGGNYKRIVEEIQFRFKHRFTVCDIDINVNYKLTLIQCPSESDNAENALDLLFDSLDAPNCKPRELNFADKQILQKSKREKLLIQELQNAIQKRQFTVFYQPIFSVKQQKYTTAEALVRLPDSSFGFISPDEFIPLAEKNGLIVQIGELVFRTVCDFITKFKLWEKGIEYIHVNISVIQCMQERLYEKLLAIMDEFSVPYRFIQLEVTESAAITSNETLMNNMKKMIEKEVLFALDDYGMGFSNTSNILRFPFNCVKLDKSIIRASCKDTKARKLILHTISMFKDMGINVVAEGVETKEMSEILTKMDCDYFQGFYYSKPISGPDFIKFLEISAG